MSLLSDKCYAGVSAAPKKGGGGQSHVSAGAAGAEQHQPRHCHNLYSWGIIRGPRREGLEKGVF